MSSIEVDILVIGAGLYGLQAARTYLEIHPDARLVILEAAGAPGGVWSRDRVYDSFWTQDSTTIAEFSDAAIEIDKDQTYHGLFQGRHMTKYLENYIQSHKYGDSTLQDRIKLNSNVKSLRKSDGVWVAELQDARVFRAAKVIDATGLTSKPVVPTIRGQDTFKGKQIHHKEFAGSKLLDDSSVKRIAVFGGAKSAADVAYAAAKADKTVYWIIRKSGSGPAYFASAVPNGPFDAPDEPLLARLLYPILASKFVSNSLFGRFIHGTAIGRIILGVAWSFIEKGFLKTARYDRPDPKGNNFKALRPDTPLFWENDSTGVQQRADWFDTFAEGVKVVRQDIVEIQGESIKLGDGSEANVDAIVYATGWDHGAPPFYEPATASSLGLPVPHNVLDSAEQKKWADLEATADKAVLARYPVLANPPEYIKKEPRKTPYRLFNFVAPVNDNSIAFVGRTIQINAWRVAEVQSLLAVASLDGIIHKKLSVDELEADIAETVQWCRRRYLTKGLLANWLYWDCIAYTDNVLRVLDLKSHLQEGPLAPCKAAALKGLITEFKTKYYQ